MNSLNLIRELLKTDSLLTPIKPSDHITFSLTNREKKIQDCNVYETLEYPEEACRPKHAPKQYGFRFNKYMKQMIDSYFPNGTRAVSKSTEEEKEPTEEEEEDEPQKKKQKKKKTAPTIGNTSKRSITKHDKQFFISKFYECGIGSIHVQNALLNKYLNAENTTYFFDFEAISSHNEPVHIPYMCCWQLDEEHTRTEYASGEDCAKKFLDVLCERHG
eukprot:1759430-Pleurochrysis_carterae.AAC.1